MALNRARFRWRTLAGSVGLISLAAGADAPQQSWPLTSPTIVDLGVHQFGGVHAADARVAAAAWGDGPTDAGLEGPPQAAPIGASSFDVGAGGVVSLLDEVHRRLL